jgi:phosphoglucosamine mutase
VAWREREVDATPRSVPGDRSGGAANYREQRRTDQEPSVVPRIFGTDGVRGVANVDVTAELALDLSVAAAHVLAEAGAFAGHPKDERPFALVGRDPRASGEFLEAAVIAGLASAGVDVHRLGVIPTPAVAHLTGELGADLAVMISASHNPMPDNGIKFIARGGYKLDDTVENAIEARLREPWQRPIAGRVGRVIDVPDADDRYVAHLIGAAGGHGRLAGVRIVLDCADGSAYRVAPAAFRAAGAEVVVIHGSPDGLNINQDCGSTHLADLQRAVVAAGADAGFAFDGDADRCLGADHTGEIVDGDQILAVLAVAMRETGDLVDDTVVGTLMSNLGFMQAMAAEGITVFQAKVGDRYVLEQLRTGGYTLGGEQSGHVIVPQHATTGDGILTALLVAARIAATEKSLADLAGVMVRLPQVLVNVPDVDRARAETDPTVASAVLEAEAELGETGRVLLRPSGTEPLVRVMVEAPSQSQADAVAHRLADVVAEALALS